MTVPCLVSASHPGLDLLYGTRHLGEQLDTLVCDHQIIFNPHLVNESKISQSY